MASLCGHLPPATVPILRQNQRHPLIISTARTVPAKDVSRYAWAGLRRFQNIPFVEERICELHSLSPKQRQNARKQARQIRYCLVQAKEYFDASGVVSLATKPTLFYYSLMCLALAEILLKQTGESSLDKGREQHRHHGLSFSELKTKRDGGIHDIASSLVAYPAMGAKGQRFGTFELWHQSCREMPLCGEAIVDYPDGGSSTRYLALALPADERAPLLEEKGLKLLDCLQALPGMRDFLGPHGLAARLVRGRLRRTEVHGEEQDLELVIHPEPTQILNTFFENVLIHPNQLENTSFTEIPAGGGILFTSLPQVDGTPPGIWRLPSSTIWRKTEARFWLRNEPLNEFGFFYVALFIAGNYARYYPDKWLADVEQSSFLALAIEELLYLAEERVPLLALSELTRAYHIIED